MSKKDSLGDRMKDCYESISDIRLTRRTPVIIRLDGKAFHSFTKIFQKPYDELFHDAMNYTASYLCENIQGCRFAYTQSDEISLLLIDYANYASQAWFDYRVQKICSIAASTATLAFNRYFTLEYTRRLGSSDCNDPILETCLKAITKGAIFDARAFNIPQNEIVNYFIWRQQDATRNAIQMLGQCYFSHKELHKKSCNEIQEMLFSQHNINFNDQSEAFKRGVCVFKLLGKWIIDLEPPVFTQQREYIESQMWTEE